MIAEYQKKSNMGVGIGIALVIVGAVINSGAEGGSALGLIVLVLGYVAFLYGCFMFAVGKGYPAVIGLLGLLGLIGLLILVLIPDKHKTGAVPPPPPPPTAAA